MCYTCDITDMMWYENFACNHHCATLWTSSEAWGWFSPFPLRCSTARFGVPYGWTARCTAQTETVPYKDSRFLGNYNKYNVIYAYFCLLWSTSPKIAEFVGNDIWCWQHNPLQLAAHLAAQQVRPEPRLFRKKPVKEVEHKFVLKKSEFGI